MDLPNSGLEMDFSLALRSVRAGQSITREGWNGKGLSVNLAKATSGMTRDFLYLNYPDGERVPWAPSQTDMLADDWRIA